MSHAPAPTSVQRQIVLPLSKAVEIAYKNIRLRLSRSMLVISGIVLALAFLMTILTSDALTDSMRAWASEPHNAKELAERRVAAELELDRFTTTIRTGVTSTASKTVPSDRPKFSAKDSYGEEFADLQTELGTLPASADDLTRALTIDQQLIAPMSSWIQTARKLRQIKDDQTSPQRLQSLMKSHGVPTTPDEIRNNRIQSRWLLALALLVAFVGILNAMLMSVTERFREIGTMKCLGALNGFIVKLFLLESLFQGIVGTLIGLIVGLALSIASASATYGSFAWKQFPTGEIATAAAMCLIIGVSLTVAGAVYPAWQAARMQPIDAMRVDT
jgi:hypothetical protein